MSRGRPSVVGGATQGFIRGPGPGISNELWSLLSGVWSAGDPVEAVQRYLDVLKITEEPPPSDE